MCEDALVSNYVSSFFHNTLFTMLKNQEMNSTNMGWSVKTEKKIIEIHRKTFKFANKS